MWKKIKEESGNIVVFSASALMTMLLFASLAIDIGCLLTAKNQLQSGVDASALAGATGLVINKEAAYQRAIEVGGKNTCIKELLQIQSEEISFPAINRVRVENMRPVNLFFSRIIGIHSVNISAAAVAELGIITGTNGMRPWGLPDMGWPTGAPVVVKAGALGAPATNPSFFYPVDFPPLNRGTPITGADAYNENIIFGSQEYVHLNDILQVEPGNMVGPTIDGVNHLIAQDPYAYWNGQEVVDSSFPGTSSPRIVKIPLYDPNDPPSSGRNTIEVIGLGSFFIIENQGSDVIGIYMEKVTSGKFGQGYSFLQGTRLVE